MKCSRLGIMSTIRLKGRSRCSTEYKLRRPSIHYSLPGIVCKSRLKAIIQLSSWCMFDHYQCKLSLQQDKTGTKNRQFEHTVEDHSLSIAIVHLKPVLMDTECIVLVKVPILQRIAHIWRHHCRNYILAGKLCIVLLIIQSLDCKRCKSKH